MSLIMNWWPEARRNRSLGAWGAVVFGVSVVTAHVVSILTGARQLALGEIVFGVMPFVFFGALFTLILLRAATHERLTSACAYAVQLTCVGGAVSVVLALFGIWNDGSRLSVLAPGQIGISMVTLGVFPFGAGPDVLVRFLPPLFAFGLALRLFRARIRPVTVGALTLLSLFVQDILLHAASIVAGILAFIRHISLESSSDAFRLLVSAQADGFWARLQPERFLVSNSLQAENGLLIMKASIVFLFLTIVCLTWVCVGGRNVARALVKRVFTKETIRCFLIAALGSVVMFQAQTPHVSYTDFLALAVFVVTVIAWNAWWRFRQDLESMADDAFAHPDRPLPSGMIATHDLEAASTALLVLVLYGALLCGWPVFVGIICATGFAFGLSDRGFGWMRGIVTHAIGFGLTVFVIGGSAAMFALRDLFVPAWVIRVVLAGSVAVGFAVLLEAVSPRLTSVLSRLIVGCLGLMVSVGIAQQPVLWYVLLPALAGLLAVSSEVQKWKKFSPYVADFVLVASLVVALVSPTAFRHV